MDNIIAKYPEKFFSDDVLQSEESQVNWIPPRWIGLSIDELKHTGQFLENGNDSPYRRMFIDFYEYCKRRIKGEANIKGIPWYRPEIMTRMKEIDKNIDDGKLREGDDLVAELVKKMNEKCR